MPLLPEFRCCCCLNFDKISTKKTTTTTKKYWYLMHHHLQSSIEFHWMIFFFLKIFSKIKIQDFPIHISIFVNNVILLWLWWIYYCCCCLFVEKIQENSWISKNIGKGNVSQGKWHSTNFIKFWILSQTMTLYSRCHH